MRSQVVCGTGAWKTLTVIDLKTNKQKLQKKFYKADFDEVWQDPECSHYVNVVFNFAHADIMGRLDSATIDPESYEEVRSVALDLED